MDAELRKRLEEAAKELADKKFPKHRASENDRRAREDYQLCRDSCIVGIELGYKEAIEVAKEWLKKQGKDWWEGYGLPFSLADFEADMNKLWEEQK